MKSPGTVLGIVLAIALPSCAPRTPPPMNDSPGQALEKGIATQDRVNRYLHRGVVPRLIRCWTGLEGEGTVAVQIQYRREGELWAPGDSAVRSSTLAKGQGDLALRCFQEAVRDTSFPVEQGDGEAKEFQVNWSFPVPWPQDIIEVARMISTGGGGGGCGGGKEAPGPACWDCGFIPIISFSYCKNVCSGYSTCSVIANGCSMGPITPKCITVSPFGNSGGLVIY